MKITSSGLMLAGLLLIGCGQQPDKAKSSTKQVSSKKEEHSHGKGPNNGVIFDLGKYHAEFTVDHNRKECMILILGNDEKTPKAVLARDLSLTTKETKTKEGKVVPSMTIKLKALDEKEGKATKFAGADPGLENVANFQGTVLGEIDNKPSQGEFKE